MAATLGALAIPLIASAVGGAVSSIGGALSKNKERKHDKDMATIHTTEEGFNNFGDELEDNGRFNLNNAGRPVIFPGGSTANRLPKKKFSL